MIDWIETLAGVLLGLLIVVAMLYLSGCATTYQGLCIVQAVGKTDSGLPVIAVNCEKHE